MRAVQVVVVVGDGGEGVEGVDGCAVDSVFLLRAFVGHGSEEVLERDLLLQLLLLGPEVADDHHHDARGVEHEHDDDVEHGTGVRLSRLQQSEVCLS